MSKQIRPSPPAETMNYSKLFRVEPGHKIDLNKIDPDFTAEHKKKRKALREIAKMDGELRRLQYLLYADGGKSLLICLQALDAGGKDGTINHVLGAMNPQGAYVHGFKVPSKEEASHDFLWRIEQQVPAKGQVAIFNRSHYEDVLVVRVHDLVPKKVWEKRYDLINDFEKNLVDNGTHILKFYLYISPEEQLRRFKKRLEDPDRQWKISEADYAEREYWDDYTKAYEAALTQTSTKHAPWFIIPANKKWFRNLAIAKIVVETMEAMDLKLPKPTVDIKEIYRKYHKAAEEEAQGAGKKKRKPEEASQAVPAKKVTLPMPPPRANLANGRHPKDVPGDASKGTHG